MRCQKKLLLVLCALPLAAVAGPYDDGIPPAWREQHFGVNFTSNPDALAVADPDGDGANNYQEFLGRSNPNSAVSVPKFPASVSTYAGSATGGADGFRLQATFDSPGFVMVDRQQRVWIAEADIPSFNTAGIGRIRRIDQAGQVSTIAGNVQPGLVDGPGLDARFRGPMAMAVDSQGNVFVADRLNHRIRRIDVEGSVTTFAGSTAGYQDATGTAAQFRTPIGIGIDGSDNLYVADFDNYRVRKITPLGEVSTFAGGTPGFMNGDRSTARFNSPHDVAVSEEGTVYVADWVNGCVRKIATDGLVTTFASGLSFVETVALDGDGSVYATVPAGGGHHFTKFAPDGTVIWRMSNPQGYLDGSISAARFVHYHRPGFLADGSIVMSDHPRVRLITTAIPALLAVSPAPGLFTNNMLASLATIATNAAIHFTLDGTDPTHASTPYSGPILLNAATTIRSRAFVNGNPVSQILTSSFQRVYALADGIPAAWREEYFGAGYLTDPRVAADADPDGDGATNLQEFATGSHPLDPLSGFRVSLRMSPTITWRSVPGEIYRVLRKESLAATDWTVVAPAVFTLGEEHTFVDTGATNNSGFYIVEPVPRTP